MEKNGSYLGKIANSASQNIQAPNQIKGTSGGTVKEGNDLRSGK